MLVLVFILFLETLYFEPSTRCTCMIHFSFPLLSGESVEYTNVDSRCVPHSDTAENKNKGRPFPLQGMSQT